MMILMNRIVQQECHISMIEILGINYHWHITAPIYRQYRHILSTNKIIFLTFHWISWIFFSPFYILNLLSGCGISLAKQVAQRRIVGGDDAGFGNFPWQAYIRIGSSRYEVIPIIILWNFFFYTKKRCALNNLWFLNSSKNYIYSSNYYFHVTMKKSTIFVY